MFSRRDLLLLFVTFASILGGVLAPGVCAPLQPYPIVCMMLLLFLSFLSIQFRQIWESVRRSYQHIMEQQYRLSLFLFAVTNLGVFSRYSDFFFQQPATLLSAVAIAFVLGGIHVVAGILVAWRWDLADQLSAVISLWIVNKVLVIVFSSQFFSPLEPTVAAMYTIPFYALVIPVRAYRNWKLKAHLAGVTPPVR